MLPAVVLFAAIALLTVSPAAATTIGSNLLAAPNGGVCPTSGLGEASCSFVQVGLADDHAAAGGVRTTTPGVITGWKISTGPATPATASLKVRLRVLEASGVSHVFGAPPYEEVPLSRPGVHVLPARLPIAGSRQYVVIDTVVTGRGGGEAAAPFAYLASGAGSVWKWSPALSEGMVPQSSSEGNLELLFNAVIEPDRDRDGFGDRTQDRCPKDPTRQADCDRRPPRIRLTYRNRQNFLADGKLVVFARSNEDARVFADGQIEVSGAKTGIWGVYGARQRVEGGEKGKFVLRFPHNSLLAVARASVGGHRVVAKVFVAATDVAGNQSGTTIAVIAPKR